VIQTQVGIRTATEADTEAVRTFLARLSAITQYQRFFTGLGTVSPSLVRGLVTETPRQRIAIAVCGAEVIAHAMAAINSAGALELGVVVAEAHRNQGLATRLIAVLLEQTTGADRLLFDVLCENQLVVDWIRRSLPDATFERDGHTLTCHAQLRPALVAAPAA
jgi:GNAT superfamily N-acetyltransferase